MADITLTPVSPVDVEDGNYWSFSADSTSGVLAPFDDVPASFDGMLSLLVSATAKLATSADDSFTLTAWVEASDGTTILAGSTSTTAVTVGAVTSTTNQTIGPISFPYVDTAATKADWDGARLRMGQEFSQNMAADGSYIMLDVARLDGTYNETLVATTTVLPLTESIRYTDGVRYDPGADDTVVTSAHELDAPPVSFVSMREATVTITAQLRDSWVDDDYRISARLRAADGTMLAGNEGSTSYIKVGSWTSTTPATHSLTWAWVNNTATAEQWATAQLEFGTYYTENGAGPDGNRVLIDSIEVEYTYEYHSAAKSSLSALTQSATGTAGYERTMPVPPLRVTLPSPELPVDVGRPPVLLVMHRVTGRDWGPGQVVASLLESGAVVATWTDVFLAKAATNWVLMQLRLADPSVISDWTNLEVQLDATISRDAEYHVSYVGWSVPAETLPVLTQNATGTLGGGAPKNHTGTASSQLPALTQTAQGATTTPAFTGSATSTLPLVAQSVDGTTAPPTFSATAVSTLAQLEQSAAGEVVPPAFTGTASTTLPPVTQTASGATTRPVFTGSISQTLPALGQSATGQVQAPALGGSATSTLPAVTQQASGSVEVPTYTGAATSSLPALGQTASGQVAAPTFTGSAISSLPAATQQAVGATTRPTFTATATSTLSGLSQAATATFTEPQLDASITSLLPALEQSATGATTRPTYGGQATSTLPAVTQSATGTHDATVEGSITSTLPGLGQQATGSTTRPVYSGTASSVLPAFEQQATGDHEKFYAGEATSTLSPATQTATGNVTPPRYDGTAISTLPSVSQRLEGLVTVPILAGVGTSTLPKFRQAAQGRHYLNTNIPVIGRIVVSTAATTAQLGVRDGSVAVAAEATTLVDRSLKYGVQASTIDPAVDVGTTYRTVRAADPTLTVDVTAPSQQIDTRSTAWAVSATESGGAVSPTSVGRGTVTVAGDATKVRVVDPDAAEVSAGEPGIGQAIPQPDGTNVQVE